MIELSFSKLLLLAVIALVVLGPEKLPKAARMAGAMLRRVRLGWDSVRSEVERELQMEEIRRTAREASARAEAMRKSVDDEVRSSHAAVNQALAEVSDTTRAPGEVSASAQGARHGDA
ncbi:MAG TPA: Sec-independent protein translocase protein TatB [Rhodanobacteraceae bacterium]